MISFRKPKRNVRQRRRDSDDEGQQEANNGDSKDGSKEAAPEGASDEGASAVARFQAAKKAKDKKKKSGSGVNVDKSSSKADKDSKGAAPSALLSFGDDEEDSGAVFQVKKSSQSRKLIKQKKQKDRGRDRDRVEDLKASSKSREGSPKTTTSVPQAPPPPKLSGPPSPPDDDDDLSHFTIKDNLPKRPEPPREWTLSGREAEALHMEEEEEDSDDGGDRPGPSEGLRSLLQGGAIPDANAIHLARKRRQAAREKGGGAEQEDESFIPVSEEAKQRGRAAGKGRLHREEDEEDDGEEQRMSFTGVTSSRRDRQQQQEHLRRDLATHSSDEERDHWEEMQIRKAMKQTAISDPARNYYVGEAPSNGASRAGGPPSPPALAKPKAYNLQGIKDRLKGRLSSMDEVHRRHVSDADRAVDELITSQAEIERLETAVPDLKDKHIFFQDLRGYIQDLTECYNEKVANIKYLEDKLNKSKSHVCQKLMERRRQDIRDQMMALSSKPAASGRAHDGNGIEVELAARQRRAAEREGRRRRRQQQRQTGKDSAHCDGMSSDDELESLDQATLGKVRADVEAQARGVLEDVTDDFATLKGIMARFGDWREAEMSSYNDAFVSICLPKIFSPLVRLQLLFWNPFAGKNELEGMEWHRTLASYSLEPSESESGLSSDPDRRLLSLVVEKVLLPKLRTLLEAAYDPMSTAQTKSVTGLLKQLVADYPTVSGDSKQVRELLALVKDKIKACVEVDLYIPIGYAKQISESPQGPHAAFANRQFWSCFKLIQNILCWHGLLGDGLLSELALTSALNRYLLIGLGLNPDPVDAIQKAHIVVTSLPKPWLAARGAFRPELERFAGFLANTLGKAKGVGPQSVEALVQMLSYMGFDEEAATLKRNRAA